MSGYSDPSDPNYFRLSDIGRVRACANRLRDWCNEPADWPDDELVDAVNELMTLLYPAQQPSFDVARETDLAFLAALDRGALPAGGERNG